MDRELEIRLVEKAKRGDRAALTALIVPLVSWVRREAARYATTRVLKDDLAQEAVIGLLLAVRRYDPTRGLRFSSYAKWWIKACLLNHRDRNNRLVAPPSTRLGRKVRQQLRRVERALEHKLGRPATDEELADYFGAPVTRFIETRAAFHAADATLGERLGEYDLPSAYVEQGEQLDARRAQADAIDLVATALAELSPRERSVIERRFLTDEPETFREIGDGYGLSRERIRQIQHQAMAKMRERLEAEVEGA